MPGEYVPYINPTTSLFNPTSGVASGGVISQTVVIGTGGGTVTTAGLIPNYMLQLERIAQSLDMLTLSSQILVGAIAPLQPIPTLASITGTISGTTVTIKSSISGNVQIVSKLILTGMILTRWTGDGYFGGLTRVTHVDAVNGVLTISSQFENIDGDVVFAAGGVGTLTCTPPLTGYITPGMQVVGQGVLPGTYIVDGIGGFYTLNQPMLVPIFTGAVTGALPALTSALGSLEADASQIANLATNNGIHTIDPYTLVAKAAEYANYAADTATLSSIISKLTSVPNDLLAQIKTAMKSVIKQP